LVWLALVALGGREADRMTADDRGTIVRSVDGTAKDTPEIEAEEPRGLAAE
jgi:hypothetical protein